MALRSECLSVPLPPERHGQLLCFRFAQARAAGWTRAQIATAIRRGTWTVLERGVYISTTDLEGLDPRGLHLVRVCAAQLLRGPDWLAARRSAAVVYGMPLIGTAPDVPQLLVSAEVASGRPRTRHHRVGVVAVRDRWGHAGVRVTSPQRMVCDIGRDEPFRNGVVVADAVLRHGLPREELERCCSSMAGWPGVRAAREVIAFADGRAESPLESISRCAVHDLGIEPPEPQVEIWVGGELIARVDFLWRRWKTIGEADGFGKYGVTDGERASRWAEQKRRTERLEDLGFEVVHWGWQEAWRPAGVLDARLQRAFARGRRQELDPRVWFRYPDGTSRRAA